MKNLLEPYRIGDLTLSNRVAMAPLTRICPGVRGIPAAFDAAYYAHHAVAGLVITEAANVSPMSAAYELAPGIYDDAQMAAWIPVVDAVHADGGRIFMPLWHGGRVASYALLNGRAPLSPSGMNEDLGMLQVYGALRNGYYTRIAASPSRAMTLGDIDVAVQEYRHGATQALRAGIDGVEVHAGGGYLPQQFLSPQVNRREDMFGGSLVNRARFLRLILDSLRDVMPACRIGVRLSPFAQENNAVDPGSAATYSYVARLLEEIGIGYIHVAASEAWREPSGMDRILSLLRPHFHGTIIVNAGITLAAGAELVASGRANMIAFGQPISALSSSDSGAQNESGMSPSGWQSPSSGALHSSITSSRLHFASLTAPATFPPQPKWSH